jgi:hypothetical protein
MSTAAATLDWVNPTDFAQRVLMKSFDSRAYSINDFLEWQNRGQLELNPRFQRREVWSEKAKSYLMDTILRGKPIPKVFMRQKINVTTKMTVREVVDGQQRLRTILSFLKDGFCVIKTQNPTHGGLYFSQLPPDVQAQVLAYEVAADILVNLPDAEILDIFSRLNSYAIVLNEQELINAKHFSAFKLLSDEVGRKYYDYWVNHGILTPRAILRMAEVSLVADLFIAMREGIQPKKSLKRWYKVYEASFGDDIGEWERKFDETIRAISLIFPEGLKGSEFSRVHLFYSLFMAVAHCLYGVKDIPSKSNGATIVPNDLSDPASIERARNGLDKVAEIFGVDDVGQLSRAERDFLENSRRATTDGPVRLDRTVFLLSLMS